MLSFSLLVALHTLASLTLVEPFRNSQLLGLEDSPQKLELHHDSPPKATLIQSSPAGNVAPKQVELYAWTFSEDKQSEKEQANNLLAKDPKDAPTPAHDDLNPIKHGKNAEFTQTFDSNNDSVGQGLDQGLDDKETADLIKDVPPKESTESLHKPNDTHAANYSLLSTATYSGPNHASETFSRATLQSVVPHSFSKRWDHGLRTRLQGCEDLQCRNFSGAPVCCLIEDKALIMENMCLCDCLKGEESEDSFLCHSV